MHLLICSLQASQILHEHKARYPERILFTTTPPPLVLEALEVFYRIHASAVKYLLRHDVVEDNELEILERHIQQLACSPFALRQDDLYTKKLAKK